MRVFYSWQSDSPNATNRTFILKALEDAAKAIRNDATIEVEPVIDRDTSGVPGAPDITDTILRKIDQSQVFVCDVSIVNPGNNSRPTPNPNVLIELGYAIKSLGWDRIIIVINVVFGGPESLPFDLRTKRCLPYRMANEIPERAPERKILQASLEQGLRLIFAIPERETKSESNRLNKLQLRLLTMIDNGKSRFSPSDFHPNDQYGEALKKFQVEANELVRLAEDGYIRRIMSPKESFESRLYIADVLIIEALTALGYDALKS